MTRRLDPDKALAILGRKLRARLAQDHSAEGLAPRDAITRFLEADSSPTKRYAAWILRTYLTGGIRFLEDLPRTRAALAVFDRHKRQMARKDIGQVRDLPSLKDLVEPFLVALTAHAEKKRNGQGQSGRHRENQPRPLQRIDWTGVSSHSAVSRGRMLSTTCWTSEAK